MAEALGGLLGVPGSPAEPLVSSAAKKEADRLGEERPALPAETGTSLAQLLGAADS